MGENIKRFENIVIDTYVHTYIEEVTLSDGSKAYNVIIHDLEDNYMFRLEMPNLEACREFGRFFDKTVCYVEGHQL